MKFNKTRVSYGISPPHSCNQLDTGINRVRVEKAKTLMLTTEYSLEKIAQKVGFLDTRALGRVFKRIEGIVPSKYREIARKNEGNQK